MALVSATSGVRSCFRWATLLVSLQVFSGCSPAPNQTRSRASGGNAGTGTAGGGSGGVGGSGAAAGSTNGGMGGSGTFGGAAGASAGTSSGGSSGSGGGSAGGSSDPCAAAAICDDFEASTIDSAWSVQMSSTPVPVLDTTKFHGGSQSVKFVGSSQQAFLVGAVPAQAFYIRAYMNLENPTSTFSGHAWFIVGSDNATQGDASQIRLGHSTNHTGGPQVDLNVYSTMEHTQFSSGAGDGCNGCWTTTPYPIFQFAADTWYCVEAFFNGPSDEFQVWVDENEIAGLHVTPTTMAMANGGDWSPTYQFIKFGAGANTNTGAVWYDDVVVSTTPIGCL